MSDAVENLGVNPLEDTTSKAALAYAEERRENIRTFVRTNPEYYVGMFDKIGASSAFTPTFNIMAGIFGPVWFGARGLWNWALPFLIIEVLAFVQIARGLFGGFGFRLLFGHVLKVCPRGFRRCGLGRRRFAQLAHLHNRIGQVDALRQQRVAHRRDGQPPHRQEAAGPLVHPARRLQDQVIIAERLDDAGRGRIGDHALRRNDGVPRDAAGLAGVVRRETRGAAEAIAGPPRLGVMSGARIRRDPTRETERGGAVWRWYWRWISPVRLILPKTGFSAAASWPH